MTEIIEGTVSTDENDGIEDAMVTVADAATKELKVATTTDETGAYSVSVAPDTYDVRAEKIGFEADKKHDVTVGIDETKTVDLTLTELSVDVVGEITDGPGIGVLGSVRDDSEASIGVQGEVTSGAGYGLYTPNDARIDGTVETTEEWQVAVDGKHGIRLAAPKEFQRLSTAYTGSGSVVMGHLNDIDSGVAGAVISGGGRYDPDDDRTRGNRVTDHFGTIGGGVDNRVGDDRDYPWSAAESTVSGGRHNKASGRNATVSGGRRNEASYTYATVSGGDDNEASASGATVSGGRSNTASNNYATVDGGSYNRAIDDYATVSGGSTNQASGSWSTIGGGSRNEAKRIATVGGGFSNKASGRLATVPGGERNTADGDWSFAAGRGAKANHDGAFVFGNSDDDEVESDRVNEIRFQAGGGFVIENLSSAGVGGWGNLQWDAGTGKITASSSSARYKMNIESLSSEPGAVLDLEPRSFKCKETGKNGVGLIAEEVAEHIPELVTRDVDGRPEEVGYDRLGVYLIPEVRRQRDRIDKLEQENAELRERLAALEEHVGMTPVASGGGTTDHED